MYIGLPPSVAAQVVTVANVASLPPASQVPIGSVRVTQDNGDVYASDGTAWHLLGGGSTAGVDSVNGLTGVVVLPGISGGDPDSFTGYNAAGDLSSIPGWNFNETPVDGSGNVQLNYQPNNLGDFPQGFNLYVNVDPLQNSPNDGLNIASFNANLDSAGTGFSMGTGGRSVSLVQGNLNYGGNGSTYGLLAYCSFGANIGNGTDPVTIKGFDFFEGFFTLNAGATIDGGLKGYGFQPNLDAAAASTGNFGVQVFYDFANIGVPVHGYDGLAIQPALASIASNSNFNAISINPNIATMTGNAGITLINANANVTTLGTGGFNGLNINPTLGTFQANTNFNGAFVGGSITTMGASGNYQGFNVSPNITTAHGNITAYNSGLHVVGGDATVSLYSGNMSLVTTTGDTAVMNVDGLTANGKQSQFGAGNIRTNLSGVLVAADNQGVQGQHTVFTEYHTPDSVTITGTDIIMNILSPDVNMGNASSYVSMGPSGLGVNMVGFAGQIHGHGGMDQLSALIAGGIFLEDFTTPEWRNVNALIINGGFTGTVTNATAFYHEVSGAGLFATNHWGAKIVTAGVHNWFKQDLIVGGTTGLPTNDSIAIEVQGTTQAVRFSNLSTVERLALTPLAGMQVFDTTLNQMSYYNGTTWVIF